MRICLYAILVFIFGSSFVACAAENHSLKIGIISDTHYLSESLMDSGNAIQNYEKSSGRLITKTPEILDSVLTFYLHNDIDVLLIPGDITKGGEKQSHLNFTKKLQALKDKGVHIYVIPGNHDINIPNSVGYKGDNTYKVDNITPAEFADIYADFGYNTALKRDTASLSYITELSPNTWLIAIDASRYKEYTNHTISGGKISPETERWILDRMNEAKQKNIQVLGMMHHGLIEHIPFQSTLFPQYLVDDWQRLASMFADNGMKAIFTGHFHSNDISEYTTGGGNKIYDVETGTLSSYPFAYRILELTANGMDIKTQNIHSTSSDPNLAENSKKQLQKLAEQLALAKINQMGINLPPSLTDLFIQLAGQLFIMHLAGDEVMTPELKSSINQLYNSLELSENISLDNIKLDFPPADNNISIVF